MADIEKLRRNLEAHGHTTSYFETAGEAAEYLCREIRGKTVGFGGCKTADDLGLYERLGENNTVLWHWKTDDRNTVLAQAAASDIYITSANGVSETGELVNIDGTGNRVAATLYGREKVYFIIGVNKIEPDLEKAIWRARNIASPLNARRYNLSTPCAVSKEMRCYDCDSPHRICKGLVVLWRRTSGTAASEVVIINQELGF